MDIVNEDEDERARNGKRVAPTGHICNMISIEELPEGYFESLGLQVEPRPGALMMGPSQPVVVLQEGIVEEASDDEGMSQQIADRARKEKWARSEASSMVDLPDGIAQEIFTTEILKQTISGGAEEVKEASGKINFEIDLDPRIPEHVERAGAAEDTISILVDANDPSKVLKIGSQLGPALRDRLVFFLKKNLDVFAWSHTDMVGVDPKVMCHRSNQVQAYYA